MVCRLVGNFDEDIAESCCTLCTRSFGYSVHSSLPLGVLEAWRWRCVRLGRWLGASRVLGVDVGLSGFIRNGGVWQFI